VVAAQSEESTVESLVDYGLWLWRACQNHGRRCVFPGKSKDCGKAVAESESFAKAQQRVRATFGRKVKDLRRSLKLSQADLADDAGIRRALVSDIERGEANPTLNSIVRLATALDVEPAELLSLDR
jgi:ribosome-binding protein aMBF1 (putative translation factor)